MNQEQDKNSTDFSFFMPIDLDLSKGSKDDKEWRIKGIASTDHIDLQGEVIKQNTLDITPLTDGRGIFNWDHQKGPENILGKIDSAEIKEDGLHVEGYLFKNTEKGRALYNVISSLNSKDKRRVGFSIEGKVLRRAGYDTREILGARVDRIAITMDPVNPHTYAELIKSLNHIIEPIENDKEKDFFTKDEVIQIVSKSVQKALDLAKESKERSVVDNFEHFKKSKQNDNAKIYQLKNILRKAKVLNKFFNTDHIPLLRNLDGSPTSYANIAKAWGEIPPTNIDEARQLGLRSHSALIKSQELLKSYQSIQSVSSRVIDFIVRIYNDDSSYLFLAELGQNLQVAIDANDENQMRSVLLKIQNFFDTTAIHLIYDEVMNIYDEIVSCVELNKALSSGNYNQAPSELVNGTALSKESLSGKKKKKGLKKKDEV